MLSVVYDVFICIHASWLPVKVMKQTTVIHLDSTGAETYIVNTDALRITLYLARCTNYMFVI